MNSTYLHLMEEALSAYSEEKLNEYEHRVYTEGLKEHGFPRLTANIGILIANGKRKELLSRFLRMMDFCCEQVPKVKAANDFSVKELLFCIAELQKNQTVSKEKTDRWLADMKTIQAESCYDVYAVKPEDNYNNWVCFTAVSEWMRHCMGLCDATDFVDLQIESQLKRIDKNGMYQDPDNPMIYDLVSRGLFCLLLHLGYKGKYAEFLSMSLKKAGLLTLQMQSVTGEVPFGGRSQQCLFNEPLLAIVAEFEVNRYAKEGNNELASAFKFAANQALQNLSSQFNRKDISHVKNHYSVDSMYGCENYAYFDKYMISVASYLYIASLFCNDDVEPKEIRKSFVLQLDENFHKTFLRYGEYCAELETHADFHYDCNGLGRVHRKNAPSPICLSIPGTATPIYSLAGMDSVNFSIAPGIVCNGKTVFATEDDVSYEILHTDEKKEGTSVSFLCRFLNGKTVETEVSVTENGVRITAESEGEVALLLPAFAYDGKNTSEISQNGETLQISYQGWVCSYQSNSPVLPTQKVGRNRNGEYRIFQTLCQKKVSVFISINLKR